MGSAAEILGATESVRAAQALLQRDEDYLTFAQKKARKWQKRVLAGKRNYHYSMVRHLERVAALGQLKEKCSPPE